MGTTALKLLLFLHVTSAIGISTEHQREEGELIAECNFDSPVEWCGYKQTQTIGDLVWSMKAENDNRFAAVEASNTKQPGTARLLSARYQLFPLKENKTKERHHQACLRFLYRVSGGSVSLLHVVANLFNITYSRNTQWYVRHPEKTSSWIEQRIKIDTSEVKQLSEDGKMYIRVLFDVTTESGSGNLDIDNIMLSYTAMCGEIESKAEQESKKAEIESKKSEIESKKAEIELKKPIAALTIEAVTEKMEFDRPSADLTIAAVTEKPGASVAISASSSKRN